MKKLPWRSGEFLENFLEWMGSSEGLDSMEALDCVFNALDSAKVDPIGKKIIWSDDQSLSIEQTVERIIQGSCFDKAMILSHVIGWLRMEYVPEGLDETQMEQFENQIDNWMAEYENKLSPPSDF